MTTSTGVTDKQKSQLKKQFQARLKSRADTRGSSKRRTGKDLKDVKGGVKETATSYADSVKKAYAGAETDHSKSPLFNKKQKYGSGATGQGRKDVRAWGENITAAYKKKYNIGTGKSTAADRSAYKQKQVDVDKRRRHIIGKKAKS